MRILDYVQPDPSQFTYIKETNTVCVRHGEARNAECRYDPANLKKNQRWSFYDEKDLQAALDNSYQARTHAIRRGLDVVTAGRLLTYVWSSQPLPATQMMEKRLRGGAAGELAA